MTIVRTHEALTYEYLNSSLFTPCRLPGLLGALEASSTVPRSLGVTSAMHLPNKDGHLLSHSFCRLLTVGLLPNTSTRSSYILR